MKPGRRGWFSLLANLSIAMGGERFGRDELACRARKMSFETDTRRLGVRMTEFLRDRLRPRWLRGTRDS